MSQFTRETLQASVTEKGSQNEQKLPGYFALDDAAGKIPQGKENILRRMIVKLKTQIKSVSILNVFESCIKTRNFIRIYQIIWSNMLMSIFLFIFQLLDAMGPLSKVWATAECAKNSQDKQVEVSLGYMLRYLDQTVVLLGQA